jgi:hypothetical protein
MRFEECNPMVLSKEKKYLSNDWGDDDWISSVSGYDLRSVCKNCHRPCGEHSLNGYCPKEEG